MLENFDVIIAKMRRLITEQSMALESLARRVRNLETQGRPQVATGGGAMPTFVPAVAGYAYNLTFGSLTNEHIGPEDTGDPSEAFLIGASDDVAVFGSFIAPVAGTYTIDAIVEEENGTSGNLGVDFVVRTTALGSEYIGTGDNYGNPGSYVGLAVTADVIQAIGNLSFTVAAGDYCQVEFRRDSAVGADTHAGYVSVFGFRITE